MEPMIVEVQDVYPIPRPHLWIGTVLATSRERLAGAPRVTLTLYVRFQTRYDESPPDHRQLRQLAREEALRFLDIA